MSPMQLFSFNFSGKEISLVGSADTGLERLLIDNQEVSQCRNFGNSSSHRFELPELGLVDLSFNINMHKGVVEVKLSNAGGILYEAEHPLQLKAKTQPEKATKSRGHTASMLAMGLKLLKSAKVIKIALLGTAVGGWALMLTWQFALVLVSVIVFHEYGHLRAMQYFGLKTKGMYLIPFVGGLAIGEKAKTQWQDVVISMMGPIFGLFMSIAFYIAYLITENHFVGLIASLSALINIFNLLPVYPLDGGRVIKALVFSSEKYWGFALLIAISATGFALAVSIGWVFICVFIVIGLIDLLISWRDFSSQKITPLSRYGMWFSFFWYAATIGVFVFIIRMIASSGLPGSEIANIILSS